MRLAEFIRDEVLRPRLERATVLVVYDPERRYRALCHDLADMGATVVDAGESSIESREVALRALQALGTSRPESSGLLVWVPHKRPVTDEDRQRDPFALYAACGAIFPDGDGDHYLSLCLRARPDHVTEIRRIFNDDPNPPMEVIDAVGGGLGWPRLQAVLKVASPRELLLALLNPSERQARALGSDDAWPVEAHALLKSALGLTLTTRSKKWKPIAEELWRFVLFSEFAFDLPGALPAELQTVPRAPEEARMLIEDVCETLRNDLRARDAYIAHAQKVETELRLREIFGDLVDPGTRDTFPFEDTVLFAQTVDAFERGNVDAVREALRQQDHSVWSGSEERQARWALLQAAHWLVEKCDDVERELAEQPATRDALIDFYATTVREADRLHREFEIDAGREDPHGTLAAVVSRARVAYRTLANRVQREFIRHLERLGWPPEGRLNNADVFDTRVTPLLRESGRRVAMLLIDALRYELGIDLIKELDAEGQVVLEAAFAPLPTVTPVGMAALLPGAAQALRVRRTEDGPRPVLGDEPLLTVAQRMQMLRARYGARFAERPLADFTADGADPGPAVDLFVLRSTELDSDFEWNPEAAPGRIAHMLRRIRIAVQQLRKLGFGHVVIVADHGFFLNTALAPGDVCGKPAGTWSVVHERLLLGDGGGDSSNWVLPAEKLGIRGDYTQAAGPRALVAYRGGQRYLHGGASLQETMVPVIQVRLRVPEREYRGGPRITLSYRDGARKITGRRPSIVVTAGDPDLYSGGASVELLLEAHDRDGQIVGEAQPGGHVSHATRTISIRPGETLPVTLRMDDDFEGRFTVKALAPETRTAFATLDLETAYMV